MVRSFFRYFLSLWGIDWGYLRTFLSPSISEPTLRISPAAFSLAIFFHIARSEIPINAANSTAVIWEFLRIAWTIFTELFTELSVIFSVIQVGFFPQGGNQAPGLSNCLGTLVGSWNWACPSSRASTFLTIKPKAGGLRSRLLVLYLHCYLSPCQWTGWFKWTDFVLKVKLIIIVHNF